MAQKAQVIDVTKSYIPGDPNAFPENLVSTDTEDKEEKTNPVNFYEGYNFLPTSYGYRSFFGTTARLNIPAVPSRVQFILSYQSDEYVNNLIALCEDGIWIIDPTLSTNEWKHVIIHTFDVSIFEEWTWCIIENSVYMYKQGGANVYHTSNIDDVVNSLSISIVTTTPTFLNMSGQMGIFKAGTRLGFWDSANSVAWSSNLDLNDFTPSLENLAGNTIFGYVVGRITHVRDHGEGFIVYSTKSIVGIAFSSESNLLWDAHNISNTTGVALGREVTQGINNSEHIVNATAGLHRIGSYNGLTKVHEFSPIAVEISDVIKENRDPVFLDVVEGRYLYLHIINNEYINGKISFETIDIPSMELDEIPYPESTTIPPSLLVKMIQKLERDTTDEVYGETLTKYVEDGTPFDIIEWEASYRMSSTLGLAEKYVTPSLGANFKYGDAGTLDRSSIGWDNRTPTGSIFVPIGGDYNSLDMGLPLFSYNDLQNRTTESASNFSTLISKILRFQTDAFTHEDNKGTYSLAYQTQQPIDTIPSYLDVNGRTSLGLLEGMYNVESIWKDYEKRQDSSIARFTEIIKDLKPFSWKANSIYGNLESIIEDPIYELFDMYKPYGNVGITALEGSKGFFFYKQYRDYYDCILAATRNVTAITEYSTIGNGICEAPIPVNYFDALDVVPAINGVVTRISLSAHKDNYIQDLVTQSISTGIYLNGFDRLMEFVPLEDQGIIAPWKPSGAITLGVKDFPGGLTTYWCECIPRQYVQLDSEWQEPNVIIEATISISGTAPSHTINQTFAGTYFKVQEETPEIKSVYPYLINGYSSGGSTAFPSPNDYPLTVAAITGGSWVAETNPSHTLQYALYDTSTGDVSDRKHLGNYYLYANYRIRVNVTTAPPSGYSYRLYIVEASGSNATSYIKFYNNDFDVDNPYYINNLASFIHSLTNFPETLVVTSGNTYEEALVPTDVTLTPYDTGGLNWHVGTDIYVAYNKGPTTYYGTLDMGANDTLEIINNSAIKTLIVYFDTHQSGYDYIDTFTAPPLSTNYVSPAMGDATGGIWKFPDPTKVPLVFATSSPSTPGDIYGYHQSFNQSIVQVASYFRNLELTAQWATGSLGDKIFRGSTDLSTYFLTNKGDYVELWTNINNAFDTDIYGVVLLLRQVNGFVYIYNIDEEPLGSIIPSLSVDLGGASIEPALNTTGVFNTIGAFFTPKNKVSATLNAGVLTKGTSTDIATYSAVATEILDYLVPSDSDFLTSKYLLPPTYDEGESWYYVKDVDTIYRSGTIFEHKTGTVNSLETPLWSTDLYLENFMPLDIPLETTIVISESLGILPGAQFLIQDGTPAPSYPIFTGAFVYDLFLKKWGKMKENYKVVFSYSPVNSNTGGEIEYTNFGMDAGVVLSDNFISIFDKEPVDSWIRLGKLGYYRLGNTTALEVKAMFRANSSGSITIDSSLDGRTLFVPVRYKKTYKNVVSVTGHPSMSGRWHTIKVEGNYDLQYLEFRGIISGRR